MSWILKGYFVVKKTGVWFVLKLSGIKDLFYVLISFDQIENRIVLK